MGGVIMVGVCGGRGPAAYGKGPAFGAGLHMKHPLALVAGNRSEERPVFPGKTHEPQQANRLSSSWVAHSAEGIAGMPPEDVQFPSEDCRPPTANV
eukprot:gene12467-biopygen6867